MYIYIYTHIFLEQRIQFMVEYNNDTILDIILNIGIYYVDTLHINRCCCPLARQSFGQRSTPSWIEKDANCYAEGCSSFPKPQTLKPLRTLNPKP